MQRKKLYGFNNFVRILVSPSYINWHFCDNQSCIALTQNLEFHARRKHVEIHRYFVRGKIVYGDVEIKMLQHLKNNMRISLQ